MRVLLLSDTHGHLAPGIAALARESDAVVHAGDIGSAGVLAALGPALTAVRGNNDTPSRCAQADWAALAPLPEEARLELPGGTLVVVHGHTVLPAAERHARLRRRYPEARAIVYGHSHRLVSDCAARPWVLNPGAAGRARTHGGPSCLVLTAQTRAWTLETHRYALPGRHGRGAAGPA